MLGAAHRHGAADGEKHPCCGGRSPLPPAAAAAPPVVLSVEHRINSSSGKLVQLSRQDSQLTDKEKGWSWNPVYDSTDPTSRGTIANGEVPSVDPAVKPAAQRTQRSTPMRDRAEKDGMVVELTPDGLREAVAA